MTNINLKPLAFNTSEIKNLDIQHTKVISEDLSELSTLLMEFTLDNGINLSANIVNYSMNADLKYPRILYFGNSVTKHAYVPNLWEHTWGMDATAESADYVHVL